MLNSISNDSVEKKKEYLYRSLKSSVLRKKSRNIEFRSVYWIHICSPTSILSLDKCGINDILLKYKWGKFNKKRYKVKDRCSYKGRLSQTLKQREQIIQIWIVDI